MKYVRDYEIKTAFITMLNKLIYGYRLILTPYLKVLENSSGDEAIQRIQHLEQLIIVFHKKHRMSLVFRIFSLNKFYGRIPLIYKYRH